MVNKIIKTAVAEQLKAKIISWRDSDFSLSAFREFRHKNKWLTKQFDNEFNQFYNTLLNRDVYQIKLSNNLKNELYLFYWTEHQSVERTIRNFTRIQTFLFDVQSQFYPRLDYYRYLIDVKKIEPDVVFRDFLASWESILIKTIFDFRLIELEKKRRKHVMNMFDGIDIYQRSTPMMKTIFNFMGPFWKYKENEVKKFDLHTLEIISYYLEEDPSLIEISVLLGRYAKFSNLIEERVYDTIELEQKWMWIGNAPEEITSITARNDLNHLLMQEWLYLFDPILKLFFFKKYLESQLLSFEYISREPVDVEVIREQKVHIPVPLEKGPFILCIDTSNSMRGIPETIAKAIALAILKIALRDQRACYLINFSNIFSVIDLRDKNNALQEVLKFLSSSFGSNTNFNPALRHALEIMDTNTYFNADLLVLSDFITVTPTADLKQHIRFLRSRRNRFHGICLGTLGNKAYSDPNLFTNYWIYNFNDPFSSEKIVAALENQFIAQYQNIDVTELLKSELTE